MRMGADIRTVKELLGTGMVTMRSSEPIRFRNRPSVPLSSSGSQKVLSPLLPILVRNISHLWPRLGPFSGSVGRRSLEQFWTLTDVHHVNQDVNRVDSRSRSGPAFSRARPCSPDSSWRQTRFPSPRMTSQ